MASRSTRAAGAIAAAAAVFWLACALTLAESAETAAAATAAGWQVPPNADHETSPLMPTAAVLKKGKSLFSANCQKCHGPRGHGDGPGRDPDHLPADLAASTNPAGVMFYKVWNGRKAPVMPPFKTTMTKDEIWTVIEYARSLRSTGSP
jgi:mono/diheme cytochrome c family protein